MYNSVELVRPNTDGLTSKDYPHVFEGGASGASILVAATGVDFVNRWEGAVETNSECLRLKYLYFLASSGPISI